MTGSEIETDIDEKTCQRCGETFRRTKGRTRKEFATRKYCGEPCAQKAIPRRNRPKRARCLKDLHDLDEKNTRIDYRGHRSCKACATDTQRTRKRQRPRKPKAPPLIPSTTDFVVSPAPKPASAPEPPVWRPAGFSPRPQVGPVKVREEACR